MFEWRVVVVVVKFAVCEKVAEKVAGWGGVVVRGGWHGLVQGEGQRNVCGGEGQGLR